MKRRFTTRCLAVAVAAALLAGACAGGASPASGGSTAPGSASAVPTGTSTAAAATTAPGTEPAGSGSDDFSFAIDGEPTTFAGAPEDLPTSWIDYLINGSLYWPNDTFQMVPWLAAELPDMSDDGLTWTVRLRDGVKFSDGSAITADDVKFSFDIAMSANCTQNPDLCSTIQKNVEAVTVLDPTTVEFTLKQRFAPFLVTGLGGVRILPKKAVEDSFARFQSGTVAVDPAAVKALTERVGDALAGEDCAADEPPASCDPATYVAEIEPVLTGAGVTLPDRNGYTGEDGAFDPSAYGQELVNRLIDLNSALQATAIDQIAASLKLLDFARKPTGAGPYMFESYTAGEKVVLARNPHYWRVPVGPAKVFIPVIKDAATASNALIQGDILWQTEITSDALGAVQANPGLATSEFQDFGYYFIAFNLHEGRLYTDKNLRTAFTMCIDHDKTVEVATDGMGMPVQANTPQASWAFNPDVPKYVLDVDGAKTLIEASGWTLGGDGVYAKDGVRLSSKLYVRAGRPQRVAFAQLAKDQLKKCGIEVVVTEADFASVLLPLLNYPNNYETYLGGWGSTLDPDDYSLFHSSECTTEERPDANNYVCWSNPEGDRLLEEGRQELDQAKRKEIYAKFQALIHEDAPYYFLWSDLLHRGYSKRIAAQPPETINLTSYMDFWNQDAWVVTRAR